MAVGLLLTSMVLALAQTPAVRLVDDEERGTFVLTIGPMDLPAGGDHHGMHGAVLPPVGTVTLPRNAYLYGFDFDVVDGEGRPVPSEVLHHLNLIDSDHRELFLPISQRILAIGRETGAQAMPRLLFGYPVQAGQRMVVSVMMHNPFPENYAGVQLRVYLRYVKDGRPWPLFGVYPFQLDVAFPAGDKSFDLPPGTFARSYEAKPAMAGRVMVVGGHLHPYATSLKFEDVTANEVIWEGRPIEGEDRSLEGVSLGRLYKRLGVKIFPDHTYRVTVTYENPTGDSIPEGGMGVIGGVFLPSGDGLWPVADTTDQLYVLDRKHYLREVQGRYEQIVALIGGREKAAAPAAHVHH